MIHQFNETGIYCFKNGSNQIGTIIVEPHKTIYHIPVFGEQLGISNKKTNKIHFILMYFFLVHKMNTKDLIQFDWKMTESNEDQVFITIDSNSSVVPTTAGGLTGIFDCGK